MSPETYHEMVKARLDKEVYIASYEIVREQFTIINAQLRVRITSSGGSKLEFSEYIHLDDDGHSNVIAYSHHWIDTDNLLKIRWDNAEHYPKLPNFPHHMHDSDEKNVHPCEPMNFFKVLDYIATALKA